MKTTISLAKELEYYANSVTDIFTTKDYVKPLREAYVSHVENFYSPDPENLFTAIYNFRTKPTTKYIPCEDLLVGMREVRDQLSYIANNLTAYVHVIGIMSKTTTNEMILKFLKILRSDGANLKEGAMDYDRYMGLIFPASDVIRAVYAYGILSGLVDYYNFKELKDGET